MNKLIFLSITCLIALCLLFAFKSPAPSAKKSYQHIFIVAQHKDLDMVYVSVDGKDYLPLKMLKKETKGYWDLNPVINIIHQYESEGWELQSFTQGGMMSNCWLRREVQ